MFIYLLCLSAALLCYTGFQNQSLISLIRSIFSPCSTCCFGLGFSTTKPTCRNTSKDLGHNSRTSFSSTRGKYGVASISLKSGARPQRVTPYRAVGLRDAAFRELITKFSQRGMLEPSSSVWAARAFCVPKPGGKWRLVIDYRYLNSQIDDEQFPLPVIDDMFLKQSKNAIWSIFDLEDGFHQMHLDEASRPLTAFVTPWGLFQWTVLPMGLKTAPQMYQRMVSDCLSSLGLEPYIDDLLLGTPDTEDNPDLDALVTDSCLRQHESELRRFLQRMDDCDLTIKPSKMLLFVQRVRFCGQILCRGRRCPDPEKTASVQRWRWQDIHTPTQLKAFLGFAQWYALYIDKFADLAAPLTDALRGLDLTKKGKSKSAHPPLSARAKRELQDRLRQQHPGLSAAQRERLLRQHVCQRENRIHWSDHMV